MKKLLNKKTIVTGAGEGIGRGIAEAMAQHGSKLAICDINGITLAQTALQLKRHGTAVFSKMVDIRNEQEITDFVSR
ncbi:SDR family NAD(P)-dependent oxidoreductase [Agriterribacter sp.]|uniref:SDR family NAD(P)-dependent oxidoreductase n=1 Tax=Agriterribacter sp. TaxID=2821509 RepID=UPI002BA83900|nr:SDR family NAD(P)-dependent oxidoreductase [Agriterribacter sp.]HTN08716.1 SDR family NAD(P)-dependent oxidoreductase [Agriterribacter sp.]